MLHFSLSIWRPDVESFTNAHIRQVFCLVRRRKGNQQSYTSSTVCTKVSQKANFGFILIPS